MRHARQAGAYVVFRQGDVLRLHNSTTMHTSAQVLTVLPLHQEALAIFADEDYEGDFPTFHPVFLALVRMLYGRLASVAAQMYVTDHADEVDGAAIQALLHAGLVSRSFVEAQRRLVASSDSSSDTYSFDFSHLSDSSDVSDAFDWSTQCGMSSPGAAS